MKRNEQHGHSSPGTAHASEIVVRARRQGAGWEIVMHSDGEAVDRVDYSKDALGLRRHDWHEIDFRLEDDSGLLAFHPDKHQAIWVVRGTEHEAPECPSQPSSAREVQPLSVAPGLLRVRNDNAERCLLSFRLNFILAGSGSGEIVASLDPIMGNQNGGSND